MRKLSLIAAAGLLSMPIASEAKTLNELLVEKGVISAEEAAASGPARVSYKHGTRLEFPEQGFDVKMNLQVQARYSYLDYDESVAGQNTGIDDVSSFNLRRVRLSFEGNLLNKQFSYKVQNDFAAGGGGSALKDAWLQWNWDEAAMLRMGQYKVPFSRQELSSSAKLQFIDRSDVSDIFSYGRNRGAMLHGSFGDAGTYAAGIFNGVSQLSGVSEGENSPGLDNNLMGAAQVTYNLGDYGSRDEEGDMRKDGDFAGTMGAAVVYGQGGQTLTAGGSNFNADFDDVRANVDAGLRVAGFSLQSEFYYTNISYDDIDDSDTDFYGMYLQTGYMFVPNEWEGAFRFGFINPDQGVIDDRQEYSFVLNYFLDGHNLKLQTGISWDVTNFESDDLTDVRYQMQLAGYF